MHPTAAGGAPGPIQRPWSAVLRWTAVLTLAAAAAIHLSVIDAHLREWVVEGLFFGALALAQAAFALAIAVRGSTALYDIAIALSLGTAVLWVVSRTAGVPVGPQVWTPEPVGRADVVATLLELTTAAALAPLALPVPGPAATRVAIGLVAAVAVGATEFAVASVTADDHEHAHGSDAVVAVRVPPPGPTGDFSLADARRARRCARRGPAKDPEAARPRTRVTITARNHCFDRATITLAAHRPVVVRLVNRERRRGPTRAHTFSIYAFSSIPARRHPVVFSDPVRPGASLRVRFEAPARGSYFFQCDIHRYMRGIVVFR